MRLCGERSNSPCALSRWWWVADVRIIELQGAQVISRTHCVFHPTYRVRVPGPDFRVMTTRSWSLNCEQPLHAGKWGTFSLGRLVHEHTLQAPGSTDVDHFWFLGY